MEDSSSIGRPQVDDWYEIDRHTCLGPAWCKMITDSILYTGNTEGIADTMPILKNFFIFFLQSTQRDNLRYIFNLEVLEFSVAQRIKSTKNMNQPNKMYPN